MRLVFDRGTIVLLDANQPVAPPAETQDFPGALWDARIAALRCPARFHPALVAELRHRGVQFTDEVSGIGPALPRSLPAVALRPYQEAALAAWEFSGRRGTAVLPTGSGKTHLAIAAIAGSAVPALCLVPTRVLLDQWARTIEDVLHVPAGRLGDGDRRVERITVATFESGWRHMHHLGNQFGLLVVDEAHHFGAGLRDEALDMCTAPLRLGLTATKPRGPAGLRLDELLGPTVYELRIDELVGEYLAPFDTIVLHLDLTPAERDEYDALTAIFRDVVARFRRFHPNATWDEFAKIAGRTEAGRRAIAAWHRCRRITAFPSAKRQVVGALLKRHRTARTIVFVADNPTAYAISREHLVMPLTCDIGRKEREKALSLFREGKLRALVSAQVLNEGLDVPDADVGIVVAGSKGEREHVQRVGRVLRPRTGKRALVFELVVRGTNEIKQARKRRDALAA
ncbi:MAG: DEAD/DEAH box helicase family protein [Deltaproteobacteria bacterium]|nr:DEAD/DEAH box helicase family protein [Deltaproteobacteria bacterium]